MKNDDTFEDLEIWKEAVDLAARVHELFRACGDWGFREAAFTLIADAKRLS